MFRARGRTKLKRETQNKMVIETDMLDSAIHFGVAIEESGTLRMMRERETITLKIPLDEYLNTLDSLQTNTDSLMESDKMEDERDFTIQTGGPTLTVLTGTRDPLTTAKLCVELDLTIMEIAEIIQFDWDPKLNNLVTGTSVTHMGQNIYCNGKADRVCFKYLAMIAEK